MSLWRINLFTPDLLATLKQVFAKLVLQFQMVQPLTFLIQKLKI